MRGSIGVGKNVGHYYSKLALSWVAFTLVDGEIVCAGYFEEEIDAKAAVINGQYKKIN